MKVTLTVWSNVSRTHALHTASMRHHGAARLRGANAGEAYAHFTATEPSVKLLENIRQFGFFDMKMVDTGLINVFDMDVLYSWLGLEKSTFDLDDVHSLIKSIVDIVNTIGVTRLVIDSVTTLCYKIKSEQLIRDFLFTLIVRPLVP